MEDTSQKLNDSMTYTRWPGHLMIFLKAVGVNYVDLVYYLPYDLPDQWE